MDDMGSMGRDGSRMIEIDTRHKIYSVMFTRDGKQVLSGGIEGVLRWWRVDDGHEVGEAIRTGKRAIYAAALSPDHKWLVCGLGLPQPDVTVWDAQTREKVLEIISHTDTVFSVDISPDSTKLVTGSGDKFVFIWSLTTGERLVGPLQHGGCVVTVRFCPTGDRIATAVLNPNAKSIRIYDSKNGQQLLDIPFQIARFTSSNLDWSADGRELFAASHDEVKRFDTSSGSLLSKWSIPGGHVASIVLSRNQKFIVVASKLLSFWDTSTCTQIGTVFEHASDVRSCAVSPNDDYVVVGEGSGKITIRNLHDILPRSYWIVDPPWELPFMNISDAVFNSWMEGDFDRAEELLTEDIAHPSDPPHYARALAQRAFVRTRLKKWNLAMDDSKKSLKKKQSVIGRIALAITHVGNGDYESALREFDFVFSYGPPSGNEVLLLMKAIILFECGKHDDAILRVDGLIDMVHDKSTYLVVRAQMFLLRGCTSWREGDYNQAKKLLSRARDAIPFQMDPHLVVISLIFGWDFDKLDATIRSKLQECVQPFEDDGDRAVQSNQLQEAIRQYSAALSLNPSNPARLLVKRSKVRITLELWEDALKDADDAIKADTRSPWGYERRHAALHALQHYNGAIDAFTRMLSLIEESPDPDNRELSKKYVSPYESETAIDKIVHDVLDISPSVLIDVDSKSGRLCNRQERINTFKSGPQFKELISSMTMNLDDERIQRVVERYFQYVALSHLSEEGEASFQDINQDKSIWELDPSPSNENLGKFCEIVRTEGYRWAWIDTCCVDKTNNGVLNQSVKMRYKWYEGSAATFVHLIDVASPSSVGDLTMSMWTTRTFTPQELFATKVIRFYTQDWKPYIGDTHPNHKESPEIMEEVANCMGIPRETIIAFNPDTLNTLEKLRLISTRNGRVEEDIAYSLIGIFETDITPCYGEGYVALGHLLEDIVNRSGEVMVFNWTGKTSPYNSCLPSTATVYSQLPRGPSAIDNTEMDTRVAKLRDSLSEGDALEIYSRVTSLPSVSFANRRLHLPCISFAVKSLCVQHFDELGAHYSAQVSIFGKVKFQTSDRLSPKKSHDLILVHPFIRYLCDPPGAKLISSSSSRAVSAVMDNYTRALQLVVRLQQPFCALLLQRQPCGRYKRVAAEHAITIRKFKGQINTTKDVRTEVVEIL